MLHRVYGSSPSSSSSQTAQLRYLHLHLHLLLNIPVNLFPTHPHKTRLRLSQSLNSFSVHSSYLLSNLHVLVRYGTCWLHSCIILTCAKLWKLKLVKRVKIRHSCIGIGFLTLCRLTKDARGAFSVSVRF